MVLGSTAPIPPHISAEGTWGAGGLLSPLCWGCVTAGPRGCTVLVPRDARRWSPAQEHGDPETRSSFLSDELFVLH